MTGRLAALTPCEQAGLAYELMEPYRFRPMSRKYNLIECCWGILEIHWGGTLLNSVTTVVEWARTMTWNGVRLVVSLLKKTQRGEAATKNDEQKRRSPARMRFGPAPPRRGTA